MRADPLDSGRPQSPMIRILLILSLLPIAAALVARWWFALRVLGDCGKLACRADLGKWLPAPGDASKVHRADGTAAEFGLQLREKALAEWRQQSPGVAKSRENSRRFGLAVPPLSAVVAVFAVLVGKLPVTGSLAVLLAATAVAAALGILTLPPELAAISRAAKKLREERGFPNSEAEDAVIRCAHAHAWEQSLPPILRWFQR